MRYSPPRPPKPPVQRSADAAVTVLAERYDAASPVAVGQELAAAAQAAGSLTSDRDAVKLQLHDVTVELGVIGGGAAGSTRRR